MWWQRRPSLAGVAPTSANAPQAFTAIYRGLGTRAKLTIGVVAVALGYALPVMGASLAAFVVVDWLRWRFARPATIVTST